MDVAVKEKEMALVDHLFALQKYEEAAVHIKNVLNDTPFDPDALYSMAVVYMSREDFVEARETCQRALEYGYDEFTCFHFIGVVYQYEEKYLESEEAYLRALEIDSENGELLAHYGHLMLLTGFDEKALSLLKQAQQLEPINEVVNHYILQYYFAKSDSENQYIMIKNIMDTAGDEVHKLMNLALFHELREEEKEAREYYRQAFLLDPTNQDLLEVLAEFDERTHILFLPHRFMRKVGGPPVVWIAMTVSIFILSITEIYTIIFPVTIFYIIFAVYTWIAPLLYKWFVRGKHQNGED